MTEDGGLRNLPVLIGRGQLSTLRRWVDRLTINRPRAMAWSAACLYAAVGVDGLADLTVSRHPGLQATPVLGVVALALLLASVGSRLPVRVLVWNGPLGVALATYASASIDPSLSDPAFMFTLPVLWTGLFFGRRGALATFCLTMVGEALAAGLSGQSGPVQHWIGVTTSVAAVTGVVIALNIRNEKLLLTLHDQALLDPLTQILNRRGFEQNVSRVLSRAALAGGAGSSLVVFDVDLFKQINDSFGHDTGDRVLVHIARLLGESCRGGDLIARLGGEEFAAFLPGTDLEGAERFAVRVREALARDSAGAGDSVLPQVTLSAGIAGGDDARPLSGLLADADVALYRAKREGRDQVRRHEGSGLEVDPD